MNIAGPKRSSLALAVMALLHEEPMHVYRMRQLIQRRGEDEVVNVTQPNSLYQTISRLEREELIIPASVDRDNKRPERTTYQLTTAGRTTMTEWTRQILSTPSSEYPEFPTAICILPVLTPKDALQQLDKRTAALQSELLRLNTRLANAAPSLPRLFLLEVEYLHAQAEAQLRWTEAIADDLRTGRLTWNKAWIKKAVKELAQHSEPPAKGAYA